MRVRWRPNADNGATLTRRSQEEQPVSVDIYLTFDGNCGEVFDFYRSLRRRHEMLEVF